MPGAHRLEGYYATDILAISKMLLRHRGSKEDSAMGSNAAPEFLRAALVSNTHTAAQRHPVSLEIRDIYDLKN